MVPRVHRLDIQGLRAVAVLTVVADHAGIGLLSGGYVGVDVFFVLSGFLITSLLVREAERTERISLSDFYARRARRILPAATLVLVVTLLVSAATVSYLRLERIAVDAGWSAAFLANVHFSRLGTDYFAEGQAVSPVQHYWSLAVEEQFYLLWPVLLVLALAVVRRRGGSASDRRVWSAVAGVVALISVASFLWSVHLLTVDRTTAYFSSPGRAWELGVGALLAVLAPRMPALRRTWRGALAGLGLLGIAVAVLAYDAETAFPGPAALLPVLGTAAVVAAGLGTDAVGPARILTVRPMTWLGDRSYSWYLWHWPVLVLWAEVAPAGRVGWLETTGLVVLSLLLAVASFHLVEDPLRRHRWLAAERVRALSLWPTAVALVAMAVLAAQMVGVERYEARLATRVAAMQEQGVDAPAGESVASRRPQPVRDQLAASLQAAEERAPVAFALTDLSQLDDLVHDRWNDVYDCGAGTRTARVEECPVGDAAAERTMVVLGDSHVGQWLPALDAIGADEGYRVLPLIKYGCTPFEVDLETGGRPYAECAEFRTWAGDRVRALDPEMLVIGTRVLQGNMTVPKAERLEAWRTGVDSSLSTLVPLAGRTIVIGDVPGLRRDPLECVSDAEATMRSCTSRTFPRIADGNAVMRRQARVHDATYVETADLACLEQQCTAVAAGRMVYVDQEHLSRTWVRHVTPHVRVRMGIA